MREVRLRVVVAVFLAALLATPVIIVEFAHQSPSTCGEGPAVAVVSHTLTPYLLLNSPYNGSAQGQFKVWNNSSGTPSWWGEIDYAQNGMVTDQFRDLQWTVYEAVSSGEGVSCKGVYVTGVRDNGAGVINQYGPYANDSLEPTWSGDNGTSYDRVIFNNSFSRTTQLVDTCGVGQKRLGLSSAHLSIVIPIDVNGQVVSIAATVSVFSNYTYAFPANAGSWAVDNLSAPGGPGGGWAFSYLGPCT
jgi:hypothetical protein